MKLNTLEKKNNRRKISINTYIDYIIMYDVTADISVFTFMETVVHLANKHSNVFLVLKFSLKS